MRRRFPRFVFALGDRPKVAFNFMVGNGLIVEIDLIADVDKTDAFDLRYCRHCVAIFRPEATQPATPDDDMGHRLTTATTFNW